MNHNADGRAGLENNLANSFNEAVKVLGQGSSRNHRSIRLTKITILEVVEVIMIALEVVVDR